MVDTRADDARSAIAIMAKAPRPGEVKTRFCPPLAHGEAAELYRCFLREKIAQINTLQWATPVVSSSLEESRSLFEDLTPAHFLLIPQGGDGLGARLLSTFDQLFQQGYTPVMVIDSDTPTLPTAYLEQALGVFADRETDVVLGPTEDGGYFLIGLRYRGSDIQPIMSKDQFYVVSKNVIDPRIVPSLWRLEVTDLVRRPTSYRHEDLRALSAVPQETTLQCISNEVGDGLMSNARWKGAPMGRLLDSSSPQPGVKPRDHFVAHRRV